MLILSFIKENDWLYKVEKNQALSFPCYSNEHRKDCEIHPRTIVPHDKGRNTVYILAAPLQKAAPLPQFHNMYISFIEV